MKFIKNFIQLFEKLSFSQTCEEDDYLEYTIIVDPLKPKNKDNIIVYFMKPTKDFIREKIIVEIFDIN